MKLMFCLTAGALAAASAAGAQGSAPQRITYDDAVAIALKQNVSVKQAENATQLSDATVAQQQKALLPNLSLNVSGSNNVGRNFSQSEGAIINQQSQALSSGLSSSLTLFDGGRNISALRSARSDQQASEQDLARTKQSAVFTVASNFVTLTNANEQLKVQEENLTALQNQEQQIEAFVKAGSRPVADLYQQQASVANAQVAVVQAQRAVELAKLDLIQTLQLDPTRTYDFVATAVTDAAMNKTYNLDSLVRLAYTNRADLAAQSARVEAAGQDIKAAAASKLPTISLTGSYSTAYNSATDLSLANQLDQRRGGGIGIGVSIPLFDRGTSSAAQQRAEIARSNAQLALSQQRQAIALDVRRAYLDFTSAKQQLTAATAQLAAAQKAVEATQARYKVGAATLVEVSQAQAQEVSAASAVATARNNLVLQEKAIEYAAGVGNAATDRNGGATGQRD
jgi:outer membrane protein